MVHRQARSCALAAWCLVVTLLGAGCVIPHPVRLEGDDWHYRVPTRPHSDSAIVAVIDGPTREASYAFRAFSSGIGHRWIAEYGEMLVQVADVELPQLVGRYARRSHYVQPDAGGRHITLVLGVPAYVFRDYRAELTLHARAFGPGNQELFSGSYEGTGDPQQAKMIGAGPFGQKSAVRVSSLQAYQRAFEQLRRDLLAVLEAQPGVLPAR